MGMVLISLVAFLLLPAFFIYSLVKPEKLNISTKHNPKGKWSRGKFSAGLVAAWVIAVAIGIAITPEPDTTIDFDEMAAEAGLAPEDYTVHENGAIEVYSKIDSHTQAEDKVLWYQDDLSKPVKTVGISDVKSILTSAGLTPAEIIDSSDSEGEPKKIYLFNSDTAVTTQFEHGPNFITLTWYQFSDEAKTIEYSQQSLKDAYKLARAMAGREGFDAVMYISNGGKYRSKPIGGYPSTGQCNDGICFIHMNLNS